MAAADRKFPKFDLDHGGRHFESMGAAIFFFFAHARAHAHSEIANINEINYAHAFHIINFTHTRVREFCRA